METYYFIEKSSVKKGPLKYSDLKSECLNKNDLVWRNDSDIWKSASEYEELNDIIIAEPPLTLKEIKIAEFNSNHSNKIIVNTLVSYMISSVLLGILSYVIAISSWENYLKETDGKYVPDINKNYDDEFPQFGTVSYLEIIDNQRYPLYGRGLNLENVNGIQQGIFFRFSKAFYSKIYLTRIEQKDNGKLVGNLLISSFVSFFPIFLLLGAVIYYKKRQNIIKEQN
jgi:hypothetical protein